MKIIYKQGDLLEAPEPWILHGCNAQGVMGSGVAKAIRAKYPEAFQVYRAQQEVRGLQLGDVSFVCLADGKTVFNGITQEFYGTSGQKYVSYDAIEDVIFLMDKYAKDMNKIPESYIHVAMPKIGAGLGGGDWDVIAAIIESGSTHFQPVVYTL